MPHQDVTRRAVVAGTGVLAVSAGLAACGSDGNQGAGPASPDPAQAASPGAPSGERLAATGDIPVGGGKVFADKKVVVTQPSAGKFIAFSAVCTHQGCMVNEVAEGTIDCPCHGSKYAIADGSVVSGPAKRPLAARSVAVSGDALLLQ